MKWNSVSRGCAFKYKDQVWKALDMLVTCFQIQKPNLKSSWHVGDMLSNTKTKFEKFLTRWWHAGFWKEKSVEDVVTLGPMAQATLVYWVKKREGIASKLDLGLSAACQVRSDVVLQLFFYINTIGHCAW